jgi:MbtH protein
MDEQIYEVVVNQEEQYSIWPVSQPLPNGWNPVGIRRSKPECLEYIKSVWVDMKPASLRKNMQ